MGVMGYGKVLSSLVLLYILVYVLIRVLIAVLQIYLNLCTYIFSVRLIIVG